MENYATMYLNDAEIKIYDIKNKKEYDRKMYHIQYSSEFMEVASKTTFY